VLAAVHLARSGRSAEIAEFVPKDLPADEPLSPHAGVLRARGLLASGRYRLAGETAARAASIAGFPAAVDATIVHATALEKDGSWREAAILLDRAPGTEPRIAAARIRAAHGDIPGARNGLAAPLLDAKTAADDSTLLLDALVSLVPDPGARFPTVARARVASRARALVEDNHADLALALLHAVNPSGTPSLASPAEALAEAEALQKLGRPREAGPLIGRARAGDPATRDGATYLAARIAAGDGRFGAYRAALESLARGGSPPWRQPGGTRSRADRGRGSDGGGTRRVSALPARSGSGARSARPLPRSVDRFRARPRCRSRRRFRALPRARRCARRGTRRGGLLVRAARRGVRPYGGGARGLPEARGGAPEPLLRNPRGAARGPASPHPAR